MDILATPHIIDQAKSQKFAEVEKVAREFEAVFISQMLQHMYASVPTDGPFGGGHSEQVYRSMMVEEYGKSISESGGIGIAENITREILKLQEVR
jgi:Rod binding domain-containing protein